MKDELVETVAYTLFCVEHAVEEKDRWKLDSLWGKTKRTAKGKLFIEMAKEAIRIISILQK